MKYFLNRLFRRNLYFLVLLEAASAADVDTTLTADEGLAIEKLFDNLPEDAVIIRARRKVFNQCSVR